VAVVLVSGEGRPVSGVISAAGATVVAEGKAEVPQPERMKVMHSPTGTNGRQSLRLNIAVLIKTMEYYRRSGKRSLIGGV
jgi:hypothetical protein